MSTRLVFDLAPMTCPALAEAAFADGVSVRLKYDHPEDMPQRLRDQIPTSAEVDLLQRAGNITDVKGADTDALVRFSVSFGGDEEPTGIDCKYVDLVPVERVEDKYLDTRDYELMFRRQFKEAHEEALQRRAEGSDPEADEASVEAERLAKDPTGAGERGVPPLEQEVRADGAGIYRLNYTADTLPAAILAQFGEGWTQEDAVKAPGTIEDTDRRDDSLGAHTVYFVEFVREGDSRQAMVQLRRDDLVRITHEFAVEEATPGAGATFITKVYLEGTTAPILVNGEARAVAEALETGTGFVWFQVVNKNAIVSHDEVGLLYPQVKSVKSDNETLDRA